MDLKNYFNEAEFLDGEQFLESANPFQMDSVQKESSEIEWSVYVWSN